jgi:hypothetical protein
MAIAHNRGVKNDGRNTNCMGFFDNNCQDNAKNEQGEIYNHACNIVKLSAFSKAEEVESRVKDEGKCA